MALKKITLALPELMFKKLKEEKDKSAYDSVQEVIKERFFKPYSLHLKNEL